MFAAAVRSHRARLIRGALACATLVSVPVRAVLAASAAPAGDEAAAQERAAPGTRAAWERSAASPRALIIDVRPVRALAAAVPPAAWNRRRWSDRGWRTVPELMLPDRPMPEETEAPSTARDRASAVRPPSDAPTLVGGLDGGGPGASLFIRATFDVPEPRAVRTLELRIAYQDGFVAYLNGREIARRNVPLSPPGALPSVPHGREPERIYVPISSPSAPGPAGGLVLESTDNVLALEIRPTAGRAAQEEGHVPFGRFGLAAFAGVRIVRGPYLIAPAQGSVDVAWETDRPARAEVRFQARAPGGASLLRRQVNVAATRHVVRLSPLVPGLRYRYQVDVLADKSLGGARAAAATFTAAPAAHQPLRFVVYGDMRAPGHQAHARVVAGILREQPALVLNTGDLVATGSEESAWQRYFEITSSLGAMAPVVPALGNHEAYLGGTAKSWTLFGLRAAAGTSSDTAATATGLYTSFDWGGAHFVVLDSNRPDVTQRDWLARDLALARRHHARAVFAICHDGPWSHGTHGGSRAMERDLAATLAAGGTDVLFSGHDHLYERGRGVTARGPLTYVVSGGGGAPLYAPTCQPAGGPPAGAELGAALAIASADRAPPLSAALPPCPGAVAIVRKAFHYVVVEVDAHTVRLCPRTPDGQALEPCVEQPLRAGQP